MDAQFRTKTIKIIPIGNSKGVRIPKTLLKKYGFKETLLLEETDKGLLLRNKEENKLSWGATFKAMADEQEQWEDFDTALLDGLEGEKFDS